MECNNKDYIKSNQITEVKYNRFIKGYADDILKEYNSTYARQFDGQRLIDYLCDKYKIKRAKLLVTDKPRLLKNRGNKEIQTYGRYYPSEYKIIIWNTTAKTNKTISPKSFFDTLIHEFCHHYDFEFLKLNDSLHTKGFYMRINDLKNKLR